VPLAPRAHAKDDAVDRFAPVGMVPAGGLGRPEFLQEGENPLPQVVGHLPDGGQGLDLFRLLSLGLPFTQGGHHGCTLWGDPPAIIVSPVPTRRYRLFSDSFLVCSGYLGHAKPQAAKNNAPSATTAQRSRHPALLTGNRP